MPIPAEMRPKPSDGGCGCRNLAKALFPRRPDWEKEPAQGVTSLAATMSLRRSPSKNWRHGPIFAGTASGEVYILDLSEGLGKTEPANEDGVEHDGIRRLNPQHKDSVTDIDTLALDGGSENRAEEAAEFLIGTASKDHTAMLLRMKTEEAPNPAFSNHKIVSRHFLFDYLCFGGGGRRRGARIIPPIDEEVGSVPDSQDVDEGNDQKTCLKFCDVEHITTLTHRKPVKSLRLLGYFEGKEKAASVATCTEDGAILWDLEGHKLMILPIEKKMNPMWTSKTRMEERHVQCQLHTGMAAVRKRRDPRHEADGEKTGGGMTEDDALEQALLFVSGSDENQQGWVAVWGFEGGIIGIIGQKKAGQKKAGRLFYSGDELVERDGQGEDEEEDSLGKFTTVEPLCVYNRSGVMLDIDQCGVSTTFAVQLQAGRETVSMWRTEAVAPGLLVVEPDGPASLLIQPGQERELHHLPHPSKVSHMAVVEDPDGAALVVGCDDGVACVWDLAGDDAGQVYAQLRSLSPIEILLPPFMLLVTAAQVLSFSFGPAVPWNEEIHKPATRVHHFMMLDFKYAVEIDSEKVFWMEMKAICGVIIFFIFSALTTLPQQLERWMLVLVNTQSFKREQSGLGPCHMALTLLESIHGVVRLVMQLVSTVFVVPIIQSCAEAVDCVRPDEESWVSSLLGNPNKSIYLASAPTVLCYRGPHTALTAVLFVIVPFFIVILIPFAAVSGDTRYVPAACLYDSGLWGENGQWRKAATRKATEVHMAFLHVVPKQAFRTQTLELLGKILLPVIATWTTSRPMTQMVLISIIGFGLWLNSILAAPYVERKFCVLVQDVKLFTSCAMLCGAMTVWENDPEAKLPLYILVTSGVWVFCLMMWQLCVIEAQKPFVRRFALPNSEQEAELRDEDMEPAE